jgi:hypothetical protein
MSFDPDAYLAGEKQTFDPDAYLAKDEPSKSETEFDPNKYLEGEDLKLHNTVEVDPNIIGGDQPITESELDLYAKGYGVDKEKLRDYVGWRGGVTE